MAISNYSYETHTDLNTAQSVTVMNGMVIQPVKACVLTARVSKWSFLEHENPGNWGIYQPQTMCSNLVRKLGLGA